MGGSASATRDFFCRAPVAATTTLHSDDCQALQTIKVLRYVSLAVVGGYTAALCYRVGVLRYVLPCSAHDKLESMLESVKTRTQPIGDVKRFALVRAHLIRVYGWAASGMAAVAAGAALFRFAPRVPIVLSVASTLTPAILFLTLPKGMMLPASRVFSFYLCMFSTGYTLGPIAWVAQDTLIVFVLLSGCTMAGLCLPLFLTRGLVSYVVSAQTLACALALSLVTTPKGSHAYSPFKHLKEHSSVQLLLNGDVNILLTMQLTLNLGICLLHTMPTIYRFTSWDRSETELVTSVDSLKEAFCICAGWSYLAYRFVRVFTRFLIHHVVEEDSKNARKKTRDSWAMRFNPVSPININQYSSVASGFIMILMYIKIVSLLQRGDPTPTLNQIRGLCTRCSPAALLLGNRNVFVSKPYSTS